MKESQSETRYNVKAPFLVGSYKAASNCYTSGGDISIASPIYEMEDGSKVSRIFPYGQIIRGDGGCYLNAALVGILNRCVNDQKKWQQFRENVIANYKFAEDIINEIESKAINNSHDGAKNGLDRAKLNEILQQKGNGNLATRLAKTITTPQHEKWIEEYNNKIADYQSKLEDRPNSKEVEDEYIRYINIYCKYKGLLETANKGDFANLYEESVLKDITKKLILNTDLNIYTFSNDFINCEIDSPGDWGLLDKDTIYLFNPSGAHFDLCYGKNDPMITELNNEKHNVTKKRGEIQISIETERLKLLTKIKNTSDIEKIIEQILQATELKDATLSQLELINAIYEAGNEENKISREKAEEATKEKTKTKTGGDTDAKDTTQDDATSKDDKLLFDLAIDEIMEKIILIVFLII